MTASLMEDIANAPEPEPTPEDEWGKAILEQAEQPSDVDKPVRRRRGRPRKVDPETGEPVPPTPRTPRVPRSDKLKEELLEPFISLATDLATVAPTVSGVLIVRAEKTVDGVVDLASGHKRTLAALHKVAKVSKGTDVLETVLLVLVAAAVDSGRLPLASPLLDNIGHVEIERDDKGKAKRDDDGKILKSKVTIREIYNKMHPEGEESQPAGPPPMPDFGQVSVNSGAPLHFVPMNNLFEEPRG